MASAAEQEVWLARPGELIVSQVEELATRIGGRPLYPAGCPAVAPQLTACQACGNQLALILQVGQRSYCYIYAACADHASTWPAPCHCRLQEAHHRMGFHAAWPLCTSVCRRMRP